MVQTWERKQALITVTCGRSLNPWWFVKKNLLSTRFHHCSISTFTHTLTRATRLTMLMLKLTFSSSVTRGVGSIKGMVSSQADTYMIGADRNVLITIPDVTWGMGGNVKTFRHQPNNDTAVKACFKCRYPPPLAPCCNVRHKWPHWVQWGRLRKEKQSLTNLCGWHSCCSLQRRGYPPCLYRPAASLDWT